jgi:hypothetical protein
MKQMTDRDYARRLAYEDRMRPPSRRVARQLAAQAKADHDEAVARQRAVQGRRKKRAANRRRWARRLWRKHGERMRQEWLFWHGRR